jgi:hypothetical protein
MLDDPLVHDDTATEPWMPRITDFSRLSIMGVGLSTCTSVPGPTSHSTKTRRCLARSLRPPRAASWRFPRSAAFITGTSGTPPDYPPPPTLTRSNRNSHPVIVQARSRRPTASSSRASFLFTEATLVDFGSVERLRLSNIEPLSGEPCVRRPSTASRERPGSFEPNRPRLR